MYLTNRSRWMGVPDYSLKMQQNEPGTLRKVLRENFDAVSHGFVIYNHVRIETFVKKWFVVNVSWDGRK